MPRLVRGNPGMVRDRKVEPAMTMIQIRPRPGATLQSGRMLDGSAASQTASPTLPHKDSLSGGGSAGGCA
jgi:hypothetical protein